MNWRSRQARRLVKRVSSLLDTSYYWHCQHDFNASAKYGRLAKSRQRRTFWLARLLDREAMTDQLVNEGWWG